jgi:hypothetical protein
LIGHRSRRNEYLRLVGVTIDQVADYVEAKRGREEARRGRRSGLCQRPDISVQKFGAEAVEGAKAAFNALTPDQRVTASSTSSVGIVRRMSAMEEKLREENKSLWQKVYDATVGPSRRSSRSRICLAASPGP